MSKGIVCFSLDVELLWGKRDLNYQDFIPLVKRERRIINDLLVVCKKNNVSFTWAIVGNLFLAGNQLWHGKDIINKILKNGLQEIASHSFSHIAFGNSSCTKEIADKEIRQCVESAEKMNIKLRSFAFPKNSIGHLDVLKKYGFIGFRGKQSNILPEENPLHRMVKALDLFLPFSPPVYDRCIREQDLINVPASFHFLSNRGIRKFIPKGVRFKNAKKGIDKAIQEKKIFHLWTHPLDLADEHGILLDELREVILYAIKKRDEGLLAIETMENIVKKCYE